jgi:tetratricopeptide (TPR) repeat protein
MTPVRAPILAVCLAVCGSCSDDAVARADRELAAGRYRSALSAYRAIEDARQHDPRVTMKIGVALYRLGELAEAASAFDTAAKAAASAFDTAAKAAATPADRGRALHNLGNALAGLNRPAEALAAYRLAIRNGDRESTRLNYELVLTRLPPGRGAPPSGGGVRPENRRRDRDLFAAARELDLDRQPRGNRPPRDW